MAIAASKVPKLVNCGGLKFFQMRSDFYKVDSYNRTNSNQHMYGFTKANTKRSMFEIGGMSLE